MTTPIVPQKTCSKCNESLPATSEFFYKDKGGKDGLTYHCKKCTRERVRQWRQVPENAERDRESSRQWCRENTERRKQYRQDNAEHIAQKKRKWRKNNPEKVREYKRKDAVRNKSSYRRRWRRWNERHREERNEKLRNQYNDDPTPILVRGANYRARKRALKDTMTDEQWQHALEYFNHRCAVCERPQGLWHTLAMDHWIALNDDRCPGTVATNIVPLCHGVGGCNNSKRDTPPMEWLEATFGKSKASKIAKRIAKYFNSVKRA